MTRSLDELRTQGRRHKGCEICGEPTAGYFTTHLKEPKASVKNREGEAHLPAKAGRTITSRNRSYCETHLVQVWDEITAWQDGLIATGRRTTEKLGEGME